MMFTLLKHEWLRTRSMLGTVVALAGMVVGVATLLTATGWPAISPMGLLLGAIAIVVLVPVLQLALTIDFWRSSYSRTGYFTHSLPIRGGRIYAAKLTWVLVVTLVALVVSAGLLALFWPVAASQFGAEINPFLVLGDWWAQLTSQASTMVLIGGAISFLAMYLMWPIQYYFAVSVGSEERLNRLGLGGPVLVFVGLYLVTQVAALTGMIAIPFGLGMDGGQLGVVSFGLLTELGVTSGTGGDVMPLGMLPAILIVTLLCLWRTVRSWNRKTALA
ncbi:MAG TPA: hypothetical protein VK095_12220 [Beutenbergiaceae bacterium]|nr:hypothetical protein [Beutenbergiaceae bacterium]